jgi:hypothetical protein
MAHLFFIAQSVSLAQVVLQAFTTLSHAKGAQFTILAGMHFPIAQVPAPLREAPSHVMTPQGVPFA